VNSEERPSYLDHTGAVDNYKGGHTLAKFLDNSTIITERQSSGLTAEVAIERVT